MGTLFDAATEKVGKVDAAVRLLDSAIRLWFNGDDSVSVHLLACSAYQIVDDLCPSDESLYNSLAIKDQYRKDVKRYLRSSYNFFKHADRDADDVVEFKPALNVLYIMFCIRGLELLGVTPTILRSAFVIYFKVTVDDSILTKKGRTEMEAIPSESRQVAASLPKDRFLQWYTESRDAARSSRSFVV